MQHLVQHLGVLEKRPKFRTDAELDSIAQILRKTRLFQEVCKLAQPYEIKDMLKQATLVRKEMGDIFNEHQNERNVLYIIASGDMWSLTFKALTFAERIQPLQTLGQHPVWWYLSDPERIRDQFNILVSQIQKRQGINDKDFAAAVIFDAKRAGSKFIVFEHPDVDKKQLLKSRFQKLMPTESQAKVVYHPGDIITSRQNNVVYDESNISKQLPLLYPKSNCILIRIPEISINHFFSRVLARLKYQELEFFSNLYIFQELQESEVEQLHQSAKIMEKRKGTILFKEGDPVNEFYVIRQGEIQIKKIGPVSLISEGQLTGEVDVILGRQIRDSTAIVVSTACILYKFAMSDYLRIIGNKPKEEQTYSRSQEKLAQTKSIFRKKKIATTQTLLDCNKPFLEEYSIEQPLRRKYTNDNVSVAKSFDLHSKPIPNTIQLSVTITPCLSRINPSDFIRSSSPSPKTNGPKRDRRIDKKVAIRITNPLMNRIDIANDKLEQIKTVKGFYNKLSRNIFKRYSAHSPCPPSVQQTYQGFEDTINVPPRHLRKTIGYLRQRVGKTEEDQKSMFVTRMCSEETQLD